MNILMKKLQLPFSFILIMFVFFGCTMNNSYNRARTLYKKNNFVAAIEFYDDFLEKNPRGIQSTVAQLERSDSYYQLGLKAYDRENWLLSIRLFYLSNSVIADELMDNCYFKLADQALSEGNSEIAMENYNYISKNLNTSELIPDILINRIHILAENEQHDQILEDYKLLFEEYPERDTVSSVNVIVDDIILSKINGLNENLNRTNYQETLTDFLTLINFPTIHKNTIEKSIAVTYLFISEKLIQEKKYSSVVDNLQYALEYDTSISDVVERKLEETFQFFIIHGNNLSEQLNFEEALEVFDQCLSIYPEFEPAIEARKLVEKRKWNYLESKELLLSAQDQEDQKNYQRALELYERAKYYFQTQEIDEKILTMRNLLKAEKDPKSFAQDLVDKYKNGKIILAVQDLEDQQNERFGENIVRRSGWKVQYSTGEYKYEVRYDIITPEANYYFVWLADLKKGIISPLNKISEGLM